MDRDFGCKTSPIWLIGDSSPPNWRAKLRYPLDSKHPVRHNIWTPVIDGIQSHVYQESRLRVATSKIYVRNAVENAEDKPLANAKEWPTLLQQVENLRGLLGEHKPVLVFTFGAFACEFTSRSLNKRPQRAYRDWSTKELGREFLTSMEEFNPSFINMIPLLHVSIARKFLESHRYFTGDADGNYFDYVAEGISAALIEHKDELDIWVN